MLKKILAATIWSLGGALLACAPMINDRAAYALGESPIGPVTPSTQATMGSLGVQAAPSDKPKPVEPQIFESKLKPLGQPDLDKLLSKRLIGRLGMDFGPFASIFFSASKMDLDCNVGLATSSEEVKKTHLTCPFTPDYRPTLHELLDAIALQSNSRWVYNPSAQAIKTESRSDKEISDIAIIEFIPETKTLPVELTAAKNWQMERRNDVLNFTNTAATPPPGQILPTKPAAVHLVVMGQFSSDDKAKEAELFAHAPMTLALENFKRYKTTAAARDLKKANVGPYNAFSFEISGTGKDGPIMRREWYFMVGDQLCYIVSTIAKEQDRELFPDVEAMLKTVRPSAKH